MEFDVFVDLVMTQINDANTTDKEFSTPTTSNDILIKEEVIYILQEALQEMAKMVKNKTGIDLAPVEVEFSSLISI